LPWSRPRVRRYRCCAALRHHARPRRAAATLPVALQRLRRRDHWSTDPALLLAGLPAARLLARAASQCPPPSYWPSTATTPPGVISLCFHRCRRGTAATGRSRGCGTRLGVRPRGCDGHVGTAPR